MVTFCSSAVAVYLNASSGFRYSSSPIASAWPPARRANRPKTEVSRFLARTNHLYLSEARNAIRHIDRASRRIMAVPGVGRFDRDPSSGLRLAYWGSRTVFHGGVWLRFRL